jgi:hypothetical protein
MGEIRLGMIGPVPGKAGPVVGVICNGKNILRAKPAKRLGTSFGQTNGSAGTVQRGSRIFATDPQCARTRLETVNAGACGKRVEYRLFIDRKNMSINGN